MTEIYTTQGEGFIVMNIIDKLNQDILEANAKFDYEAVRRLTKELDTQIEKNKISES